MKPWKALLPFLPVILGAAAPERSVTWPAHTMGTYVHVILVTSDSAASAPIAENALDVFFRVDSLMSNWTTTSEVARINRVAGSGPTRIDPQVAEVIGTSLDVWKQSDGAFDITVEPLMRVWGFLGGTPHVPDEAEARAAAAKVGAQHVRFDRGKRMIRFERPELKIDLGGIAKGYAVDVAAESLRARGVQNALVDLTGNMFAIGHAPGAAGWRIGIRDPRDRMPYFGRITLSGEGISTSGKYEQFVAANGTTYGHIMDPRSGRPAEGLISVTLVSKSAYTCDAWDTPLFVLGPRAAMQKARQRPEFAAILVQPGTPVDTVWVESSLRERFVLEPAAESLFVVRYF